MAYLHPDVYQQRSQDIYSILAKRMEQLKSMDLNRYEVEENMKHMQLLRKERHDKPRTRLTRKQCKQCKHEMTKPLRKKAKEYDTLEEVTLQATGGNKSSLKDDERELPTTPKVWFYPGPYLIKQVYDNGLVEVTTLQGDSLGRVNMNKLKPYHELESTQTYALQILACHLLEAEMKEKQNY